MTGDEADRLRIHALEVRVANLETDLADAVAAMQAQGVNLSQLIEQHGQLVDHVRTLIVMAQDVNP